MMKVRIEQHHEVWYIMTVGGAALRDCDSRQDAEIYAAQQGWIIYDPQQERYVDAVVRMAGSL